MSNLLRKIFIVAAGLNIGLAHADLNFDNSSSNIVVKPNNSLVRLNNVSKVYGWTSRSIVKDYGYNTPDNWLPPYANGVEIGQTGGTVTASTELVVANSNAINSGGLNVDVVNDLIRTSSTGILSRANSNTLLYFERTNSNAKLFLARNNSNSILFLTKNNSNALLFGDRNNSNALLFGDRNNSNALLFGDRNNSNTLLYLFRGNSAHDILLARNTSNALLYIARTTSAALLFGDKNNSNAIVRVNDQVQNIFGPTTLTISTPAYTLANDVFLSVDHLMSVSFGPNSSCVIDGNGHTIHLASGAASILQISSATNVQFTNVVFENYNDVAIDLGAGAGVSFGDGTYLDLSDQQELQRPMTLAGAAAIRGNGNLLHLGSESIAVSPGGTLSFQNVSLDGLKASNITCGGPTASLVLRDCNLCLENNFSFTVGSILFSHEVVVTGTNTFTYESANSSTIDDCSELLFNGAGFAYEPSVASRDLLAMADQSSKLHLANCSLSSTTTGMRLTIGTLLVDGKNLLTNTGVATSEGFCFGNGTAADDLTVVINPGAALDLVSGVLDYQNVS